jgi:hypothetical protein
MDGRGLAHLAARGIAAIRAYCETDVVNTFPLYLRFLQMRGRLPAMRIEARSRWSKKLVDLPDMPWKAYLDAWTSRSDSTAGISVRALSRYRAFPWMWAGLVLVLRQLRALRVNGRRHLSLFGANRALLCAQFRGSGLPTWTSRLPRSGLRLS